MNFQDAISEISKQAITKWGLPTEGKEPEEFVRDKTSAELIKLTDAYHSIYDCVNYLHKELTGEFSPFNEEQVIYQIENQPDVLLQDLREKFNKWYSEQKEPFKMLQEITNNVLEGIHDGWVKAYGQKVTREGKQYQFTPLHFMGKDEAMSDLLFALPIIRCVADENKEFKEFLSKSFNEDSVGKEYEDRHYELFSKLIRDGIEKVIDDYEPVKNSLMKNGETVYEYIKDHHEIYDKISDQLRDKYLNRPERNEEKKIAIVQDPESERRYNVYDVYNGSFYVLREIDKNDKEIDTKALLKSEKSLEEYQTLKDFIDYDKTYISVNDKAIEVSKKFEGLKITIEQDLDNTKVNIHTI